MPIDQMKQVLDSMENSIRLRSQAQAERRAEDAAREKKAFQEKLMLAAASKAQLDGMASNVKVNRRCPERSIDGINDGRFLNIEHISHLLPSSPDFVVTAKRKECKEIKTIVIVTSVSFT